MPTTHLKASAQFADTIKKVNIDATEASAREKSMLEAAKQMTQNTFDMVNIKPGMLDKLVKIGKAYYSCTKITHGNLIYCFNNYDKYYADE